MIKHHWFITLLYKTFNSLQIYNVQLTLLHDNLTQRVSGTNPQDACKELCTLVKEHDGFKYSDNASYGS